MIPPPLIIVGASARAAAFSALRAGLRPLALDLFADSDLAAACPVRAIPVGRYPAGLPTLVRTAPPGPWLYTGGLENCPEIVRRIARERPLWGNDAAALERARDPFGLARALRTIDLPCPAVRRAGGPTPPGRWLVKPVAGAGGAGIRLAGPDARPPRRTAYLQQFIDGESRAAVFVAGVRARGSPDGCRLLGVTRQLVGIGWLHAKAFRYCGSMGPLSLTTTERAAWVRLGATVAEFAGLRGLFGIDAVMHGGVPWPVEVNPRYTASVEVLEYGTGLRALALHRRAFDPDAPAVPPQRRTGIIGKAVYYAPRPLIVPAGGPWEDVLHRPPAIAEAPAFADIPPAGQRVEPGRPVLTVFSAGASPDECERRLRDVVMDLDRWLLK